MEPGKRIREAREKRGLSQRELGDQVGISQEAVLKIEKGKTQRSKYLPMIGATLEIPLHLLYPDGDMPAAVTTAKAPIGEADFPIYTSAEGGRGEIIVDNRPVDFAPRPAPLLRVRGGYGLLLVGASMTPEFRQGDTVLINPHLPVVADQVYIFFAEKEGSARATIKHLRRVTTDQWHVSQWNPPDGMRRDFILSRREWQWAHRVLARYLRR